MTREEAIITLTNTASLLRDGTRYMKPEHEKQFREAYEMAIKALEQEQRWIPCTPDTMPDDLEEVYVTWVNHNPQWYYTEIKDKPFTAPAVYHRGKWYWYSSVCVDTLAEYGKNDFDEVDKDIEIVAWMPLPEPYKGES